MKTEALITHLAQTSAVAAPSRRTILLRGVLAGAPGLVLLLALLGPRPDLASMLQTPVAAQKFLLPLLLAVSAGAAVLRLMRPEGRLGWLAPALILLGVFAVVPGLWRFAGLEATARPAAIMGATAPQCLIFLLGLAAAPLVAVLHGLRSGATTRPGLSGALAGLACSAAAATGYALHCPEDDPLFFAVWYLGAMLLAGAIAALAGRRALRW